MYKILIADDEQLVRDSIKSIIEKHFSNEVEVGTAKSGREAIEKAETLKPDIVFMDIMMPGINGIDAMREIRFRLRDVIFIILTAYDKFDYAMEAIKLEVMDYLLKPVNQETIIQTVNNSIEIISNRRKKREKELELKERLERVTPILERSFFYSRLFYYDHSRDLKSYTDLLELKEEGGYIITVNFGGIKSEYKTTQTLYQYFRNVLKGKYKCLVGPFMLNRIIVLIPECLKKNMIVTRHEAINIAEYIFNSMSEKVDVEISIGIGRPYALRDIVKSYDESLKAINSLSGNGIMHIMNVPAKSVFQSDQIFEREKLLLDKAASGDTEECLQTFDQICDCLFKEYASSFNKIKKKLLELMILIRRIGCNYKIEDEEYFRKGDYIEEFLRIEDPNELKACCKKRIEYVAQNIKNIKEKRINNRLILKAIEYIQGNYKNKITLEDVANELNISPHYFSKLFKDEVGETFIDYITSLRIQKSKELLEESQLSGKEICFEIGYGDPNYFSRNFKRIVGITPTEYKEITKRKVKLRMYT